MSTGRPSWRFVLLTLLWAGPAIVHNWSTSWKLCNASQIQQAVTIAALNGGFVHISHGSAEIVCVSSWHFLRTSLAAEKGRQPTVPTERPSARPASGAKLAL